LLDIERLGVLLRRIQGRIVHKPLDRISPLAVPILLDIGKTAIFGEARESAMADAADELMKEALGQTNVAPKSGSRFSEKATLKGKNDLEQRGKSRAGR
jgi:Lhr-like helicase